MYYSQEIEAKVMRFATDEHQVNVLFAQQESKYTLSPDLEDFAELVKRLAVAWKAGLRVKVRVNGVRIVAVFI